MISFISINDQYKKNREIGNFALKEIQLNYL